MHPTAMQKHAREHRIERHLEPEVSRQKLRYAHRDHGIGCQESLRRARWQRYLVKEHRDIRRNQRVINDRKPSCGIVILQRNHVLIRASALLYPRGTHGPRSTPAMILWSGSA